MQRSLYLETFHQAIIGYTLALVVFLLIKTPLSERFYVRVLILLIGVFITLRYWFFRTFETLTYTGFFDAIGMYALYLAETYSAVFVYLLGIFVNISPIERPVRQVSSKDPLPTVDVFIPTYDEPIEIIKVTALACKKLEYPEDKLNIYILDDGGTIERRTLSDQKKAWKAQKRHEALKKLAQELEINYITRERNEHAKAGNLNNALILTEKGYDKVKDEGLWFSYSPHSPKKGDLILVLDCDHVPTTDFLKNTVYYFMKDKDLFLVQTPHFFINPSPVEKTLEIFKKVFSGGRWNKRRYNNRRC